MRAAVLLIAMLVSSFAWAAPAMAQDAGGAQPQPGDRQTTGASGQPHGGAEFGSDPEQLPRVEAPGDRAVLLDTGLAAAPADAPPAVKEAVWAANEIQDKPYRYGGGHARFDDTGYDCSGTISYALHGAALLKRPLDSRSFMRWGEPGRGRWITVYTNRGHAYVVIAGLRLDTSSAGDTAGRGKGPRWRGTARRMRGFRARHPVGF